METLVQFGAGNIGRSFLGQLFSRSGYGVVFVEVDAALVDALNERGSYRVVVKHPDGRDETLNIRNVSAIHARNEEAVAQALAEARIAATAVGQRALPLVLPLIAKGLLRRSDRPLDIILAENLSGAATLCRAGLAGRLPKDYPLDARVGLIETSIGKMVPLMRDEDRRKDPLWVFAEPYNELIVDRLGFRGPIPDVSGLKAVDRIQAYVDRKLFIHNLGHCTAAYLGYRDNPSADLIWEVLDRPEMLARVRDNMMQAAAALRCEHPEDFAPRDLEEHVDDLLARFRNRALGDTVHRVGRDLYRKLSRGDRLIGAMLLARKHGLPTQAIAEVVAAAVRFRKGDEHGALFPDDRRFVEEELPKGLPHVLTRVCGLSLEDPVQKSVLDEILRLG
jgi:mannitol-1-phosphate 5-dehydrogenase